jgi:monofunctional biosynthetic peptidoglycan transglycosylase
MSRSLRLCCFTVSFALLAQLAAGQTMTSLFQFRQASDVAGWQIVNDGVMGGRSTSQATLAKTESGEVAMRFSGTLSLENNGGFASVRSRPLAPLGLESGDTILLRVRGDGRRYTFNLYTPDRRTAFSYQMDFNTQPGQWTEIRLPVDKFVAHSFGRPIPSMKLTPSQVHSVGILLGDKRSGAFEILIDQVRFE